MRNTDPYFFITEDNKIYKHRVHRNDWLLVSPNFNNENRIVIDITTLNGKRVSANKARPVLNKMWMNYNPVWEYKGKQYTSVDHVPGKKVPVHFQKSRYDGYTLVMYNGQLKWALYDMNYYPRVEIVDVNNGEDEPNMWTFDELENGDIIGTLHVGWANASYLKNIYCITDKTFI